MTMINSHVIAALAVEGLAGQDSSDRCMSIQNRYRTGLDFYNDKVKYAKPQDNPNAPVTDFQRLIGLWHTFDPELAQTASIRLVSSLQSGNHPVAKGE